MTNKIFWCAVSLVCAVGFAQTYSLHAQKTQQDEWVEAFLNGMGDSAIRADISATDSEVIVTFRIPGLQGESLALDINTNRIKAIYSVKVAEGRAVSPGESRMDSIRQYEKIIPIPAEADAMRYRFAREGDAFKIIFDRRQIKS